MNDLLLEAFRHSAWSTEALLTACRSLSDKQLNASARGYGSILATLNHVVKCDAHYVRALAGVRPSWADDESDAADLDQLDARASENAHHWEQFLSEPVDSERRLALDDGKYQCHASVVVAQALHHGAVHREQVRAALREFGATTPDVQPWEYALDTGRARWRTSGTSNGSN